MPEKEPKEDESLKDQAQAEAGMADEAAQAEPEAVEEAPAAKPKRRSRKSRSSAKKENDQASVGWTEISLRKEGLVAGTYDLAREHLARALTIFEEPGDREGIASGTFELCVLTLLQADYGQAWGHCERALQVARELGDRARETDALEQLGNLFSAGRDGASAGVLPSSATQLLGLGPRATIDRGCLDIPQLGSDVLAHVEGEFPGIGWFPVSRGLLVPAINEDIPEGALFLGVAHIEPKVVFAGLSLILHGEGEGNVHIVVLVGKP